jgi:hypothetical protein
MDHTRMMKRHIPGLIIRNQPFPSSPSFSRKLAGITTEITAVRHVDVESGEPVSVAEIGVELGESVFDFQTYGYRVLEVDQTPGFGWDVTDRHPGCERCWRGSTKEDLVVVHFGCGSFRLSDVSEVITWMIA